MKRIEKRRRTVNIGRLKWRKFELRAIYHNTMKNSSYSKTSSSKGQRKRALLSGISRFFGCRAANLFKPSFLAITCLVLEKVPASHPLTKSLTKTSIKWTWASKMWELLGQRSGWNPSSFELWVVGKLLKSIVSTFLSSERPHHWFLNFGGSDIY